MQEPAPNNLAPGRLVRLRPYDDEEGIVVEVRVRPEQVKEVATAWRSERTFVPRGPVEYLVWRRSMGYAVRMNSDEIEPL